MEPTPLTKSEYFGRALQQTARVPETVEDRENRAGQGSTATFVERIGRDCRSNYRKGEESDHEEVKNTFEKSEEKQIFPE